MFQPLTSDPPVCIRGEGLSSRRQQLLPGIYIPLQVCINIFMLDHDSARAQLLTLPFKYGSLQLIDANKLFICSLPCSKHQHPTGS